MTEQNLTRTDVLRLLTMTREQAVASNSAASWLVVQSIRESLVRDKAALARQPIPLDGGGTLPERVRLALRRRWHVTVDEIAAAAHVTAAVAA